MHRRCNYKGARPSSFAGVTNFLTSDAQMDTKARGWGSIPYGPWDLDKERVDPSLEVIDSFFLDSDAPAPILGWGLDAKTFSYGCGVVSGLSSQVSTASFGTQMEQLPSRLAWSTS